MKLNGEVLEMVDDKTLPDLEGRRLPPAEHLQLPAFSLAFFVFMDTQAAGCIWPEPHVAMVTSADIFIQTVMTPNISKDDTGNNFNCLTKITWSCGTCCLIFYKKVSFHNECWSVLFIQPFVNICGANKVYFSFPLNSGSDTYLSGNPDDGVRLRYQKMKSVQFILRGTWMSPSPSSGCWGISFWIKVVDRCCKYGTKQLFRLLPNANI